MKLACHLELRRLVEHVIERYDFPIVVEWRDSNHLTCCDVHYAIAMHGDVFARHVERAWCHNRLHAWIQRTFRVEQLEASSNRERLSRPDIRDPDDRATDTGAAVLNAVKIDRRAAARLVGWHVDDRIGGNDPIEIDSSCERCSVCDQRCLVRSCGDGDYGRARRDTAFLSHFGLGR